MAAARSIHGLIAVPGGIVAIGGDEWAAKAEL